ncbi:MAG: LEA type 2 family protein [Bacteroidales bacterium]
MVIARFPLFVTLTLLLALLFSSCRSMLNEVEVSDIRSFEVKKMEGNLLRLDLSVQVKNPNYFSMKLSKGDFRLHNGDKLVAKLSQPEMLTLRARSDSLYVMPVDVELVDPMSGILSVLRMFAGGTSRFTLQGQAVVKSRFVRRTLSVEGLTL